MNNGDVIHLVSKKNRHEESELFVHTYYIVVYIIMVILHPMCCSSEKAFVINNFVSVVYVTQQELNARNILPLVDACYG